MVAFGAGLHVDFAGSADATENADLYLSHRRSAR
jgi:hypothetical protein